MGKGGMHWGDGRRVILLGRIRGERKMNDISTIHDECLNDSLNFKFIGEEGNLR